MSKQKYYNAARAASLMSSSFSCRQKSGNKSTAPGAPAPPIYVPLTNSLSAGVVKTMVKAKTIALTAQSLTVVELVKAVNVVKAILTYRTCARTRVYIAFFILIFIFYYYKKCIDHLDQLNIDAVFSLTNCLDHK